MLNVTSCYDTANEWALNIISFDVRIMWLWRHLWRHITVFWIYVTIVVRSSVFLLLLWVHDALCNTMVVIQVKLLVIICVVLPIDTHVKTKDIHIRLMTWFYALSWWLHWFHWLDAVKKTVVRTRGPGYKCLMLNRSLTISQRIKWSVSYIENVENWNK